MMRQVRVLAILVLFICLVGCGSQSPPSDEARSQLTLQASPDNPAVRPVPREAIFWKDLHRRHVARAEQGGIDLLMVGDSITHGWTDAGAAVFDRHFSDRNAAAFGIPADRTEHLLWRLRHGELDGIQPNVVVVNIGTNNIKSGPIRMPPEKVAEGVAAVVRTIQQRVPDATVLLYGVFPRQPHYDWIDQAIADLNQRLADLAEEHDNVRFIDIGDRYRDARGGLREDLMPDLLHLSPEGFEVWGRSIDEQLLRPDASLR